METIQTRIQSKNYSTVRKAYLEDVVLPAFLRMSSEVQPVEKQYSIARKDIILKTYSLEMAELFSGAMLHHEILHQNTGQALTIHAWDSMGSSPAFLPPWSNDAYFFPEDSNVQLVPDSDFLGIYMYGEETLTLYDRSTHTAYFWTHRASALPYWSAAAPLRTLLHWFLSEHGIHLMHGAAVGVDGNAVLLAAKGGSGKSTAALHCLLGGMDYLGDDYVAVENKENIIVHNLYNSIKILPADLADHANLRPHIWNSDGQKQVIFLNSVFPQHIKKSASLKAIFIPVITSTAATTIVSARKSEALAALAPTILFQLPLAKTSEIAALKSIILQTPCYFLQMSSDRKEVAGAIKEFLKVTTS